MSRAVCCSLLVRNIRKTGLWFRKRVYITHQSGNPVGRFRHSGAAEKCAYLMRVAFQLSNDLRVKLETSDNLVGILELECRRITRVSSLSCTQRNQSHWPTLQHTATYIAMHKAVFGNKHAPNSISCIGHLSKARGFALAGCPMEYLLMGGASPHGNVKMSSRLPRGEISPG
jgi:hypothetical protein